MAEVDAVIAALQSVLKEAESRPTPYQWKTRAVNRWINQLPGGRWRWWHLKLRGDSDRRVSREEFIGHVRATLAYLETNRDEIQPIRLRALVANSATEAIACFAVWQQAAAALAEAFVDRQ